MDLMIHSPNKYLSSIMARDQKIKKKSLRICDPDK